MTKYLQNKTLGILYHFPICIQAIITSCLDGSTCHLIKIRLEKNLQNVIFLLLHCLPASCSLNVDFIYLKTLIAIILLTLVHTWADQWDVKIYNKTLMYFITYNLLALYMSL